MDHPILPSRPPRAAIMLCFLTALLTMVVVTLLRAHPQNEQWAQRYLMVGYRHEYVFVTAMVAVVFCAMVTLYDTAARGRERLARRWTPWWTAGVLAAASLLLCGGMMWCTNHDFGAYDQSIVVETLWRQHLGQVAYRDFITTNPPLFVLGLRLAAWVFGVNWDAQGWLMCAFSVVTLPWTYLLLRRLRLRRFQAFLLTVFVQVSGLLLLSFWWFNSTTAVVAGLFLLSCLLLLREEDSRVAQASYVASLALLTWVKANTAGLMGVLFLVLLLVGLRHRGRLVMLSCVAAVLSVGALLASGVTPMSVIESYAGVARSRGLTFLAFNFNPLLTAEAYFWLLCLGAVLAPLMAALWRSWRQRDGRGNTVYLLMLLFGGLISVFTMASFGDLPNVGMGPIVLAVGVAVFGGQVKTRWTSMFYTGVFCAMLCTQVYVGGARMRIRLIGPYFAPPAEVVKVQNAFFAHMRTGPEMNRILTQLHLALEREPGPVFFSARLEWAYAAMQLPSPAGLPVFYQAGTSFAPKDQGLLLQRWKEQRFATVFQPRPLVPGRADWGWFPVPFLEEIAAHYTPDATTYPGIIVWRRKPGV